MQIKKAVILSAGYGKRLNPITLSKPKPLIEINKTALLENTIHILEELGIEEIAINTHYLSKQIDEFMKNKKLNSKISLIYEDMKILGTGGGVFNAAKKFKNDPFFVFNPDTVWSKHYLKDFKIMEELYFNNNCKAVLLVVHKNKSFDKTMLGDFNLTGNLLDRSSDEKNYIYTGSQIINNSVFGDRKIDIFSMNVIWDSLIKNGELMGIKNDEEFFHITNLKIYEQLTKKNLIFN